MLAGSLLLNPSHAASLAVASGWNLLGNSTGTAIAVNTVFGDATQVKSVWKWLPTSNTWQFYSPDLSDGGASYAASMGYSALTSVDPGDGIWVQAKQNFNAQLPDATALPAGSLRSTLRSGWSLVSIGDNKTPVDFNRTLSAMAPPAGSIPFNTTSLWAWDNPTGKWFFYAPSLDASGGLTAFNQSSSYLDFGGRTLSPWTGFWVNKPELGTESDVVRFLRQSSFGPTEASIAEVQASGIAAFLEAQLSATGTSYDAYGYVDPNNSVVCPATAPATCFRDNYSVQPLQWRFFMAAANGKDQLRQRVALALSQILVTSGNDVSGTYGLGKYQQIFLDHGLGNFRDLLAKITLNPVMGDYLDMVNNDKPNPARGTVPNENYAREILQLFSIGLYELYPDGTQKIGADGKAVPSYDQDIIEGFAYAWTGWTYAPRPGVTSKWTNPRNYESPLVPFATHHDASAKQLLNGVVLPAGQTIEKDLEDALTNIFMHPNVGPFIGRQLIQQLVTSNPSPAFVGRVSAVFANNGSGVRGDMKAVVRAILLDPEARGDQKTERSYGKLFEPALFVTNLVRMLGANTDGVYLARAASGMSQSVFAAPTVFNFYPPDYAAPGTAIDGPPFGIFDASTSLNRGNFVNTLLSSAGSAADSSIAGATGTKLDLAPWQALAADTERFLDKLNLLFFNARMPDKVRTVLRDAMNSYSATDTANRARTALYLAANAPQFQIER
jgi:uncharacterized protein (DUF1800 family)